MLLKRSTYPREVTGTGTGLDSDSAYSTYGGIHSDAEPETDINVALGLSAIWGVVCERICAEVTRELVKRLACP